MVLAAGSLAYAAAQRGLCVRVARGGGGVQSRGGGELRSRGGLALRSAGGGNGELPV